MRAPIGNALSIPAMPARLRAEQCYRALAKVQSEAAVAMGSIGMAVGRLGRRRAGIGWMTDAV